MKKPLYNQNYREIIRENDSFSASIMLLDIAFKKFGRSLMRTMLLISDKIINYLSRFLADR